MSLKYGALFAGYGGLEMGAQAVLPGELAWYSEIDKGALKVLGHRFPSVPNIGDITTVDWSQVEPVDVLTGGSPCQDLSHAGKRQGMTEGTRSNLWVAMREAIAQLRPSLVIWENVRGAGSAEAASDLEFCAGCMGDGRPRVVLRALGRVVGDLADLGYVGQVRGLRAADVGSPHGRFRYFLTAYPHGQGRGGIGWQHAARRHSDGRGSANGLRAAVEPSTLLSPAGGDPLVAGPLLPTPAVNDMGEGKTVDAWDEWTDRMKAEHGNGNGHGKSLSIEAQRLLPTPMAYVRGENNYWMPESEEQLWTAPNDGGTPWLESAVSWVERDGETKWGQYASAIHRWEMLTRAAPAPTETGPKGNPRLSAAFSEWMMGLPAGWVTDVPGITRNEALRALGNGVVPQQAAEAIRWMLAASEVAA